MLDFLILLHVGNEIPSELVLSQSQTPGVHISNITKCEAMLPSESGINM